MKKLAILSMPAIGALIAASVLYPLPLRAGEIAPSEPADVTQHQVQTGQILPVFPSQLRAPATVLSNQQMEAIFQKKLKLRYLGQPVGPGPGTQALPADSSPETAAPGPGATQFHGNPALVVVGRNNKNTNANGPKGSTLAEPAAANNALKVFAAGNFNHAEFSANGGATWADVPLPVGPAAAPINCCDHDVVIDDARRVFFHEDLYINSSLSTGVARIFVRTSPPAEACHYDIAIGTALPDFPKLGLTKRFLYLTINAVGSAGGFARIYRFNIDQMVDCASVSFSTFDQPFSTFGQRVWRPAEGTNNIETMYWGQLDNSTTFRVFSWKEANAAPTSVARAVAASSFAQPDCRGGVGNFNWIDALSASGVGFRTVGAAAPGANGGPGYVAFFWQAGPTGFATQGHVRSAAFNLSDLSLFSQPLIFNNTLCFGGPNVAANKRGDLGISLAFGGRAGGGGAAAQGAVGVDDEFTPGISFNLAFAAAGTHNRSDQRYGDYFTVHAYEPCEKWFNATSYALLNGVSAANVNSRYLEFGRNQSLRCYQAHSNQLPAN